MGKHLAVDFDGTIHEYSGWPGHEELGKPIDGAATWLQKWVDRGNLWSVFTARAGSAQRIALIKDWLSQHGFPKPEQVTNVKTGEFDWFLDDKALHFGGPFYWQEYWGIETVEKMQAWWKRA